MISQQTHEELIAAWEMKKLKLQKEIKEMKLQHVWLTTMAAEMVGVMQTPGYTNNVVNDAEVVG